MRLKRAGLKRGKPDQRHNAAAAALREEEEDYGEQQNREPNRQFGFKGSKRGKRGTDAVPLISGQVPDLVAYNFTKPCPPTAARLSAYNAAATAR